MDTNQLKYFIAVCESRSITSAAETLFVSQQALSASIAKLERELHTTLFIRSTKGVQPTGAGSYLLSRAKEILLIEEETRRQLASFQAMPVNLRVGCAYGVVQELSEKLLDSAALSARSIHAKFIEYTDVKCEQAVERGEIELGFAIGPIDTSRFRAEFLLSRNYCFLLHRSHPLAGQDCLTLDQLRGESLIMLNEQFKANSLFSALCRQRGFSPKYIFEVGEIAPVENLVMKRYGIGLSTDFMAAKHLHSELRALQLKDVDYTWNVHLIWKKDRPLSKTAGAFIDHLVDR